MRALTLGQAKTTLARVLGVCTTSADVATFANEAQERLLNRRDKAVGTWAKYRVCIGTSNCLVWPRQVRSIEAFWVCNEPYPVMSEWYETIGFYSGGYGLMDDDSHPGARLIDHGMVCSFDNVIATTAEPRKIQAVCADPSDNGKKITLRYLDDASNRKYTSIDGVIQEGEQLTLSTTGVLTSSNVATNGLYHVVKEATNYPVRLYSYDVNSATQSTLLAVYEPSETNPIYRSTYAPGLTDMGACPSASSDCTVNKTVTILARLQHVPVARDNDPFVIGNLAALKLMAKGIKMEEAERISEAEAYFASAARELDGELSAYLGDGMIIGIRVPGVDEWGAGGVINPV